MRTAFRHVCAVVVLSVCALAGAAVEYPPLVEIPLDTVWLTGGNPLRGLITERRKDGTLVLSMNGLTQEIPRSRYEKIDPHILAKDSVKLHGAAALAARDWDEVVRTVQWAVAHQETKEGIMLGSKSLEVEPAQPRMAELLIKLLTESDDPADIKRIEDTIRKVLAADRHWREGRRRLVELLTVLDRKNELEKELTDWLAFSPTEAEPLQKLIALKVENGDVRGAVNLQRRLWESSTSLAEGVTYVRLLLRSGDPTRAVDVSNKLLTQSPDHLQVKAMAGAAYLSVGKTAEAVPLLEAALAAPDQLTPEITDMTAYNTGLAYMRLGKTSEAKKIWNSLTLPVARYALAVFDHQPVAVTNNPSTLAAAVAVHNALLECEQHPGAVDVSEEVKNSALPQVRLLQAVNEVWKGPLTLDALQTLSAIPGPASQRWQAYGHVLEKRYDEALALLDRLPAQDGYALAYRLYIALERKDMAKANELWALLQTSTNPPRNWMARMQLVFDAASSDNLVERFDLEGVTLPSGWVYQAPGTGIRIYQQGGKLWLDGKQRQSMDGVTRAWRLVRGDRLHRVVAEFDIADIGTGTVGIEIMDANRRSGVAVGVTSGRTLAWRQLVNAGVWSEWKPLSTKIGAGPLVLALEYNQGKINVFHMDDPDQQEPVGDWDGRGAIQDGICVSLFGTAPEGTAWKCGIDNLRIEPPKNTRRSDKK